MPQIRENAFTAYDFTDDDWEYIALNDYQIKWIRSMVSEAALAKSNLTTKDKTPEEFMRAQAYFEGQVHQLTYMLTVDQQRKADREIEATIIQTGTDNNPRVLTGIFFPPVDYEPPA